MRREELLAGPHTCKMTVRGLRPGLKVEVRIGYRLELEVGGCWDGKG